jgi:calcineurin-like phosphoesterase family protein
MALWFTSDQHFGHAGLLAKGHRVGFSSIEEMEEEIVRRHNEVVMPQDEVWHLGDLSLILKHAERVVPRLRGIKRLVPGNHDGCHAMHRKGWKEMARYRKMGFEDVLERVVLSDGMFNGKVLLSHLPMGEEDSTHKARYQAWRPTPSLLRESGCKALLHGHVHNLWKVNVLGGFPMINVGVDVWEFAPVTAKALAQEIRQLERGQVG